MVENIPNIANNVARKFISSSNKYALTPSRIKPRNRIIILYRKKIEERAATNTASE
jgi:hypothetical protein